MKYISAILFSIIISSLFAQKPDFEWAGQCGHPPNTSDAKSALASASDGSFYLAAEFTDTVQFGGKMLVSSGGTDIFLVKHDADGNPLWSFKLGGEDDDYVEGITCSNDGSVVLTGYFYGTTQLGPDNYTSYGSQDVFIAKFDAGGDFLWSSRAGGPMADYISGLSTDAARNAIITGYFYDSMIFGDTTITATSSSDIFLAKYDPEGQLLWVRQAGGSSSDQSNSASCDEDGNILLTASFYYDITLEDTTLTTVNPVGVAIARYTPEGSFDKVIQLDGTYLTPVVYVVAGPGGGFYVSGDFSEQVVFGEKTFDAGEFNEDVYIAKYDAAFDLDWAKHVHSNASDQVVGLAADDAGNFFISGHYLDTLQIDLLTMPYTLCCGSREIFIVKIDPQGNVAWGQQISGTRASLMSVALTGDDELLLSGLFSEELTIGDFQFSIYGGFLNYLTCLKTEIVSSSGNYHKIPQTRIYPNPVTSTFQIFAGNGQKRLNVRITGMNGAFIAEYDVQPGGLVDARNLPEGPYLIRVTDENAASIYSGIIIKK
jgi:hypothetical protein